MRPSTPPPALISSIASSVAFNCDCSTADVTPVWENRTPTRHGASVFSLEFMSLTQPAYAKNPSDLTSDRGKLKSRANRSRRLRLRARRGGSSRQHQAGEDRDNAGDMIP